MNLLFGTILVAAVLLGYLAWIYRGGMKTWEKKAERELFSMHDSICERLMSAVYGAGLSTDPGIRLHTDRSKEGSVTESIHDHEDEVLRVTVCNGDAAYMSDMTVVIHGQGIRHGRVESGFLPMEYHRLMELADAAIWAYAESRKTK